MSPRRACAQGFTLIELSIVLVIVGLLAGGILVGNDLIQAAQTRKLIRNIDEVKIATHAFRVKYNCVPGDCPVATSFSLGSNGNGDGRVQQPSEKTYLWDHLFAAKLVRLSGGSFGVRDVAAFIGSGYAGTPGSANIGIGPAINPLIVGSYPDGDTCPSSGNEDSTFCTGLSPQEAYGIDSKIDDGNPAAGQVQAGDEYTHANSPDTQLWQPLTGCVTDGAYVVTSSDATQCSVAMPSGL